MFKLQSLNAAKEVRALVRNYYFGDHHFDLIIIGGGPAGLTAAVYASVSRINTFFINQGDGMIIVSPVDEVYKVRTDES